MFKSESTKNHEQSLTLAGLMASIAGTVASNKGVSTDRP